MLKGDKILLRAVEPSDLPVLYSWENDPLNWKVSGTLTPYSKHILEKYLLNTHLDIFTNKQVRFIIATSNNSPIGTLDLFDYDPLNNRAGLGILIGNLDYRNQGYAKDAIKTLISYAKNILQLHQIYCTIAETNLPSIGLFKSLNFEHSGTHKQWYKINENYTNELFFQLIF